MNVNQFRKDFIAYLKAGGVSAVYTPPVDETIPFPFCVVTIQSAQFDNSDLKVSVLGEITVEINVVAETTAAADTLYEAVFALIDKAGSNPALGGHNVRSMRPTNFEDNTFIESDGSGRTIIQYTQTIQIIY